MESRYKRVALGLLAAVVVFLIGISGLDAQTPSEAPVFSDGDFWRYKVSEFGDYMKTDRQLDGVYEVVYKSGRFLVRKVDENTSQKTVQDAGLFIALLSPGAKLEYVRFPMRVGSSWTTSYVFRPRRRNVDRFVTASTKVSGFGSFATQDKQIASGLPF
jgi:hypothetical protein